VSEEPDVLVEAKLGRQSLERLSFRAVPEDRQRIGRFLATPAPARRSVPRSLTGSSWRWCQ
jgi:hypothetical protein